MQKHRTRALVSPLKDIIPLVPTVAHCLEMRQGGQPRKGMHHAAQMCSRRKGIGGQRKFSCAFICRFHFCEGHAAKNLYFCIFFAFAVCGLRALKDSTVRIQGRGFSLLLIVLTPSNAPKRRGSKRGTHRPPGWRPRTRGDKIGPSYLTPAFSGAQNGWIGYITATFLGIPQG